MRVPHFSGVEFRSFSEAKKIHQRDPDNTFIPGKMPETPVTVNGFCFFFTNDEAGDDADWAKNIWAPVQAQLDKGDNPDKPSPVLSELVQYATAQYLGMAMSKERMTPEVAERLQWAQQMEQRLDETA